MPVSFFFFLFCERNSCFGFCFIFSLLSFFFGCVGCCFLFCQLALEHHRERELKLQAYEQHRETIRADRERWEKAKLEEQKEQKKKECISTQKDTYDHDEISVSEKEKDTFTSRSSSPEEGNFQRRQPQCVRSSLAGCDPQIIFYFVDHPHDHQHHSPRSELLPPPPPIPAVSSSHPPIHSFEPHSLNTIASSQTSASCGSFLSSYSSSSSAAPCVSTPAK